MSVESWEGGWRSRCESCAWSALALHEVLCTGTSQEASGTLVRCPRTDDGPHFPHRWGDPENPADDRVCPGGEDGNG